MKTNFKIVACLFAFLALFGVGSSVSAAGVNFEIETNSLWGRDSQFRSSTKTLANKYSIVQWDTSNKASHNMWFRVIDVFDVVKGEKKFPYLTTDIFVTNLDVWGVYHLVAKRENFWDPVTKVTGMWMA